MNPKRFVLLSLVTTGALLLVLSAVAGASPDKKDKSNGRLLFGKVLDSQDNPVVNAVVYVTNTRTRAVKTSPACASPASAMPKR